MAVQFVQPHRFTAEQYRRMTEIGIVPASRTESWTRAGGDEREVPHGAAPRMAWEMVTRRGDAASHSSDDDDR